MKFEVRETVLKEVKYLKADCGVRYWEDADVNSVEDTEGDLIPMRFRDSWVVTIDLEEGIILDWPKGTVADIHYKVCDAGIYRLLDAEKNVVKEIEGYVPSLMSPGGSGYGDYVIMTIDADGKIENWSADLDDFNRDDD